MDLRLQPIDEPINIEKESKFCIQERLKRDELGKKKIKLSRLNISDSLDLIKKEKFYGTFIPILAKVAPKLYNIGKVQLNRRYSTPREYRVRPEQHEQNMYEQLSQHLKKKKIDKTNKVAGMDAFWILRKEKDQDDPDSPKKKKRMAMMDLTTTPQLPLVNPTETAYLNIMTWAKMPQDLSGSLPRNLLKSYIFFRTGNQRFATNFLQFFQFKSFLSYKDFHQFAQTLRSMNVRLSNLVSFLLYDANYDGFVCQSDIFMKFESEISNRLEPDFIKIGAFLRSPPYIDIEALEEKYKIQNLILKDPLLTIKDYEMYFKKVQQPYMKATNKKDTIFAKSFIVLDHRQKIRSTRKQMEIKKSMYNQLMGEILKSRTQQVLLNVDAFRLDFGIFSLIFTQRTKYFGYFCEVVFGAIIYH